MRDGVNRALDELTEAERRLLMRTDWGFVHQDAAQGLRMNVSAGGNIGERLMAIGGRHYGSIRHTASEWLKRVELTPSAWTTSQPPIRRYEAAAADRGATSSRLRVLVFMDEPTGGWMSLCRRGCSI